MASKDKESRLAQMGYWEGQLSEGLAQLAEKGVAPEKIAKDTEIKKIRAKIRETRDRLVAIEEKEKNWRKWSKPGLKKRQIPRNPKRSKRKNKLLKANVSRKKRRKKRRKARINGRLESPGPFQNARFQPRPFSSGIRG